MLSGFRIIQSEYLTDVQESTEPRLWRERWFTWPWRPWTYSKTVTRTVPSRKVVRLNEHTLIVHPVAYQELKRQLSQD